MNSDVIDQRLLQCQHPRLRQALQFRVVDQDQPRPENSLNQAITLLEVSRKQSSSKHKKELGSGWRLVKRLLQGLVASWQFMTCPL